MSTSSDSIPRLPRRNRETDDPKKIGLWKIGRTIGEGASGRVRIARHAKTGQLAAVKIVSKSPVLVTERNVSEPDTQTDRLLLGIEREIVIMKLIEHPNILRLYDVWETSTELYLILEYVEGGELFHYLCSKGPLSKEEALGYFQQIISAMDYCHRFNIAHRDLKPENLLLDANKNIKVADFGMAAWQANSGMLNTACGSPHYAAPEVVSGKPYNGTISDTWSCGVILYLLLIGCLPFDDEDLFKLLAQVMEAEYSIPESVDPQARDLIERMLERDLSKRITIPEILEHPFYSSCPPKTAVQALPDLDKIARPIEDEKAIDPAILANLRTLWNGTSNEELVESLLSPEQTWQKGVYHLLGEYRRKRTREFNERDEKKAFEARVLRKNTRKAAKASRDKPSQGSLPPRTGPPTPSRAARRVAFPEDEEPKRSESGDILLPIGFSPALTGSSGTSGGHTTPLSPLSPLLSALNLPPLNVPEIDLQDGKIQQFFHQIVDHLNAMQVRAGATHQSDPSRLVMQSPAPPSALNGFSTPVKRTIVESAVGTPVQATKTRPLSVRTSRQQPVLKINSDVGNKENRDTPNSVAGPSKRPSKREPEAINRTPLAEKHVQIVTPSIKPKPSLKRRARSLSIGSKSPVPSSPPKRGWLNVFGMKSTSLVLSSARGVRETKDSCAQFLSGLGVHSVPVVGDDGLLKCRLAEVRDPAGVMAVMKTVRFRVEVREVGLGRGRDVKGKGKAKASDRVECLFVLEKGSGVSFGEIYARMKDEWEAEMMAIDGTALGEGDNWIIGGAGHRLLDGLN